MESTKRVSELHCLKVNNVSITKRVQVSRCSTPNDIFEWTNYYDDTTEENGGAIFCRYDYKNNSSSGNKDKSLIPSIFNKSSFLCNTPTNNINEPTPNQVQTTKGEALLSPMTDKKKTELCSYLKLMKHGEKKDVTLSLSRRSLRVRNLEQKELEKKMKQNVVEENTVASRSTILLTPPSEDSKPDSDCKSDISEHEEKIFNFIMPPRNVLNHFHDFESWILPIIEGSASENGDTNVNAELKKLRKKFRDKEDVIEDYTSKLRSRTPGIKESNKVQVQISKGEFEGRGAKRKRNGSFLKVDLQHSDFEDREDEESVEVQSINSDNEKLEDLATVQSKSPEPHDKENKDEVECEIVEISDSEDNDEVLRFELDDEEYRKNTDATDGLKNDHDYVIIDLSEDSEAPNSSSFLGFDLEQIEESRMKARKFRKCFGHRRSPIASPFVDSNGDSGTVVDAPTETEPEKLAIEVTPYDDSAHFERRSLYSLLKNVPVKSPKRKSETATQDWDSDGGTEKRKQETNPIDSHFVSYRAENGAVLDAIYVDFYLVLIQESAVSIWNQTALGNVLGAQNLWIFMGWSQKVILNKECAQKKSVEMVASTGQCVAYVELWTKEHKSDVRQGPVADVFANVYYWKSNRMDKKALQLENINGFADYVQYVVIKPSLNIVVSWHSQINTVHVTLINMYTLAPDFQSIVSAKALSKVQHYVSSLHYIEDNEELLMGCGERNITLWNLKHGYIVTTITLSEVKLSLSTLWVKCDRGILFALQQCPDRELRLIAINGRKQTWKTLKIYGTPTGFERIRNIYIENGVVVSFFDEGVVCWDAQTNEQIIEELRNESAVEYFPSGNNLIVVSKTKVFMRHALTYLLTTDD